MSKHTAVIFTGIPACGKSTLFQELYSDTHVRINLDMLKNRRRENILIEACLVAKQSFVIDNTNITKELRLAYIDKINKLGMNEFEVISVYFPLDLELSLARNSNRSRVVPEKAIKAMASNFVIPNFDEGFDEYYKVVDSQLVRRYPFYVYPGIYPFTSEVL